MENIKKLKKDIRLLNESIAHWKKDVVLDQKFHMGYRDYCSLCKEYAHTGQDTDCKGCPIREATGQTGCQGTPWMKFHFESIRKNSYEQTERALEFIEWMTDLRNKLQTELDGKLKKTEEQSWDCKDVRKYDIYWLLLNLHDIWLIGSVWGWQDVEAVLAYIDNSNMGDKSIAVVERK